MVNQSNKKQYKVSKLYLEALDFASRDLDDNDILQIDRTQDFFNELKKSIFAGERVFVEIHGKTRGGKSTSAMVLANKLLEFIAEHNKTKKKTIKMMNVARDQSERVEKLMKESFNHDVLVTDENNDLEDTGLNITAQQALGKTISDIHAGRYVHEILISPRDFLDPNTEFMLNVVPRGMDKERQTTFLKLYVRTWDGGIDNIQLIGHVDLHVGKLIKTWEEKGKKLFFDYFHNRPEIEEYEGENDPKWILAVKKYKRKEEEFEKLAEKDFFCYYQYKKYEKMNILTVEKIFRPRLLPVAGIVLEVYSKLSPIAGLNILRKEMVKNFIRAHMRKASFVTTILGEHDAIEECMGMLSTKKGIEQLQDEIKKCKNGDGATLLMQMKVLHEALQFQIEEMQNYKSVHERYNKILW